MMRGDAVLWRSQTADIDATVKNKWCWDWLETEYERVTCAKSFEKK